MYEAFKEENTFTELEEKELIKLCRSGIGACTADAWPQIGTYSVV
jgi:hypothetical protein